MGSVKYVGDKCDYYKMFSLICIVSRSTFRFSVTRLFRVDLYMFHVTLCEITLHRIRNENKGY